jgi:hypothetical protein
VVAPSASAAPAVVNNYCRHPVYAPNGTNGPVETLTSTGARRKLSCGQSRGNVTSVHTLQPTRFVWSSGGNVCWNPNNYVYLKTNVRVYTVRSC